MPKFEFCIPTVGKAVPDAEEWFHEIKYDGYRLRVERDGDRVRLITRGGYDWTKRFPWIAEAALKNRRKQFVIDGEAVVLGVDGVSDFDGLRSGKHDADVQLYAFDCLALDGDDLRKLLPAPGPICSITIASSSFSVFSSRLSSMSPLLFGWV
jgi:bifunctional non-homologous end joining protein LigD